MHVVLVNPRAQTSHRRLPLSVLFVARNLGADHTWEIFDANIDDDAGRRAEEAVARDPARTIVMVTVMPGPQLRWAVPWTRALKARFPMTPIVWGGYFPTVYPEAVCRDPAVDIVCIGQGEATAPALVDVLAQAGDPLTVPGVALWRGGKLWRAPGRPNTKGSLYPDPPYDRLPMDRYAAKTFLGKRTYNHHTSYGCPYVCNFCAVTNMYEGRWIPDPADHVVRIVRRLADEWGADAIEFHDNNFFAWEKRTLEFAQGIEGRGIRWWGEGRIDTMLGWATETWEAMARSGLTMVFYGAESGDERALLAMDKGGLTVNDTLELNRRAKSHGVIPEFSFVLGNPGDPEGDIERSLGLVRRLKDENEDCEIILYLYTPVPLPGMYDEAERQGFQFPETLDEWMSPRWHRYEDRRNPGTPWLTPRLVRRVYDFEAVLHARYPTVSDRNLRGWQRTVLRTLARPRYRSGMTRRPLELMALQRWWHYRRPEEMGF
jgi:anaerobic magnesium-protoporphyrin IX monomethyl ester cyclase